MGKARRRLEESLGLTELRVLVEAEVEAERVAAALEVIL